MLQCFILIALNFSDIFGKFFVVLGPRSSQAQPGVPLPFLRQAGSRSAEQSLRVRRGDVPYLCFALGALWPNPFHLSSLHLACSEKRGRAECRAKVNINLSEWILLLIVNLLWSCSPALPSATAVWGEARLVPLCGENTYLQDDCTIFSKNTLGRKNETALKELWGARSFTCQGWAPLQSHCRRNNARTDFLGNGTSRQGPGRSSKPSCRIKLWASPRRAGEPGKRIKNRVLQPWPVWRKTGHRAPPASGDKLSLFAVDIALELRAGQRYDRCLRGFIA